MIGAILVVSGPTVVLPLLAYIRPARDVRSVLKWEGVLIDPLGALLGVVIFQLAQTGGSGGWQPGEMALSILVGATVGALGAGVLRGLLPRVQRVAPRQAVAVTLALSVAALVAADLIREDTGFLATLLMGMFLANQRSIDVAQAVEFHETLVQLLIGVLFVMIAASVSPSDVSHVLGGPLALVAIMVLLIRPAVVALSTWRSELDTRERAFVAWMAPRGIVAGSTASAFGLQLAGALRDAGVGVRLWAGPLTQPAAQAAALNADRGRILVDSLNREAELEEVTDAVLVSRSDDFNAFAASQLRADLGHGHVFRVAPDPDEPDLLPPAPATTFSERST